MTRKTYYIALFTTVCAGGLLLTKCKKDTPSSDTVIISTAQGQLNVPTCLHGSIITVTPSGVVTVKVKTIGWTFDVGVAYSNRNRLYLTCELGFWRRMGWLIGVDVYPLYPNAFTAVAYRIPWRKANNFSIFAGVDTDVKPVMGIFWRFGNG